MYRSVFDFVPRRVVRGVALRDDCLEGVRVSLLVTCGGREARQDCVRGKAGTMHAQPRDSQGLFPPSRKLAFRRQLAQRADV